MYCTKSGRVVWAHHPHPTLGDNRICVNVTDWEDQSSIIQSARELQELFEQSRAEGAQADAADNDMVCEGGHASSEGEEGEARSADEAAEVAAEQARAAGSDADNDGAS